ncbi:MAG: hypothetical protein ISP71_05940 [Flavobacteriales bacterium]|nr:hypothetical protein [Flavobacteriales bacterium]
MKISHIFNLFLFGLFLTIFSCKEPGCTDANAINYDSAANEDDNSCLYNGSLNIDFRLVNGNQAFSKYDTIQSQDYSFRLEKIKFYISNLQLKSSDENKFLSEVHLYDIDNANSKSLTFNLEEGTFDSLYFDLGLNSEQNSTTPANYDVNHPLGLNQNTFWAMEPSSYIFVMIEGKMDTLVGDDYYPLTYHLAHSDLLRNVALEKPINISHENTNTLVVDVDVSKIFDSVDLSEELPHQSTNSKLAQLLMDNFSTTFEIQ